LNVIKLSRGSGRSSPQLVAQIVSLLFRAVSPNAIRQSNRIVVFSRIRWSNWSRLHAANPQCERPADCQSAKQQTNCLRYARIPRPALLSFADATALRLMPGWA